MNRLHFFFILAVMLLIGACKDDGTNLSKIEIAKNTNFQIDDIKIGSNNKIYCLGLNRSFDSIKVRIYSRQLNFISEINLSERAEFKGKLSLDMAGDNFFVTDVYQEGIVSKVVLHKLDIEFNIIKSTVLLDRLTGPAKYAGKMFSIDLLSTGNYLVVWDSSIYSVTNLQTTFDPRLSILSSDLSLVSSFAIPEPQNSRGWFYDLMATELDNGSIFYGYKLEVNGGQSLVVGSFKSDGQLQYQKAHDPDLYYFGLIGLSRANENVIINRFGNQQTLTLYNLIDPATGEIIKETSTPLAVRPLGDIYGRNPLPKLLGPSSGHLMLNVEKVRMEYYEVNALGKIKFGFSPQFPAFPWFESYRQLHTKSGTIIIGVSVEDRESYDFILQELSMNGEILQE